MGSFVSKEPVRVTVEGREGEWIAIKPKLSVGDRGKLADAIMRITGTDEGSNISIDAGRYLTALLEIAVVDWHLLDENGKPVPFKPERILDLDPDDSLVDRVLEEIARRNPTLTGRGGSAG